MMRGYASVLASNLAINDSTQPQLRFLDLAQDVFLLLAHHKQLYCSQSAPPARRAGIALGVGDRTRTDYWFSAIFLL
jgi:hypothetical protein